MEKIWLKNYSPGVPAEINPDAYPSLDKLLEDSCRKFSHSPAFYNFDTTITYGQLDEYSRDFAAYLQNHLGLKKSERIAIMLPNILQYPIVMFAALRAGLIVVNVNPLYTSHELEQQLNNAEVSALVVMENFISVVEKTRSRIPSLKHVIVTRLADLFNPVKAWITQFMLKYIYKKIPQWDSSKVTFFKDALSIGKMLPLNPSSNQIQDVAFLQYTGGTTGIAKGAILTHRNLLANIQQAEAWFQGLIGDQEIVITALPLYHIFSLLANCLFFSKVGGLNVLITDPRNIPRLIKEMNKFKFTTITGVNTLFNALIKNPQFSKLNFEKLHLALGGGMAVQKPVADRWQAITGKLLLEAYGLTETSPCVTINPINLKQYNGSIGLPVSSTDIAILNEAGQEVPIGEAGELAVKGPQVMQGYWKNPQETQKVFTRDGWLLTGDVASIDEQGYVRLLERKKDVIIVSGFNVYPNEIENVLSGLPGVREVAAVAILDHHSGEAVKVFIVKDQEKLTAGEVIKYAQTYLTPYKVPKNVEFCTELPKTNVGKVLRRALKGEVNTTPVS